MNDKLLELFNLYKNLRCVQDIVEEIYTLDFYVVHYDENESIRLINYCITKYNNEIKMITGLKKDKVVVENDNHLYDTKDDEEVNSDLEYIRDCLIMIGAVQSGMRRDLKQVFIEISN